MFVSDLSKVANKLRRIIHNKDNMKMIDAFNEHGVNVSEDIVLPCQHMIQICKAEKAAKSLSFNPTLEILTG